MNVENASATPQQLPLIPPMKRCTGPCGRELPATAEWFRLRMNHGKIRPHAQCRDCEKAYHEEWRQSRGKAWQQTYDQLPERKERHRELQRTWEQSSRGSAYLKAYWQTHKRDKTAYLRAYYQSPKGRAVARAYNHRRYARKRALPATFTAQDWQRALDYFDCRCAVCNRPIGLWHTIAQDHWIPVTKGGAYTPDNIIPLCHGDGGCNNSKGNKDAHEWLLSRYSARKTAQIEKRIAAYFAWIEAAL